MTMEDYNWNDQAQGLREAVSRQRRGLKLVTITSGKGGVGKSSLTVNIALALSQMGFRVLVVDADFGLANIDVMLGINARYNMSHLLRGSRTLDEIVQQGYQGVRFISGGSGVYDLLAMDGGQLEHIISGLITLRESVDVILFDTGAGINDNVLRMVAASTEAVIVTTPEPTAILDAYALVKTIGKQGDAPPVRVVMNKAESRKEAENAIAGFQAIIRKYLEQDIESLGYVLFDAEVTRSIKRQTPILIANPNGQTARDITAVARNLARLETAPLPQKSPLARFFAKLGR
jgi:flagellar biosynthesis protein FlhG